MREQEEELALSRRIAAAVREAGGRAFWVGGLVRDRLREKPGKDVDLEVFGLMPDALFTLLREFGEPYERGAAFGVFGLRHSDIDIAMPRRETALGKKHTDFAVEADPFLPYREASRRRDFTVNALMEDPLTGEVLDFWNGREDLEKRVLRCVDAASFIEDPLRVFRAARFAAVLGFTVDGDTRRLCGSIDVSALSRERVFEELSRALLKAEDPSVFFEELSGMGQLGCFFPEMERLIGLEQNPHFHPEGDVYTHTMLVLKEGASLRAEAKEPLPFMLSCMMHDYGKPYTTVLNAAGQLSSKNHGEKGAAIAGQALGRLTNDRHILSYVTDMVRRHMTPLIQFNKKAPLSETRRLLDAALCPGDLLLLSLADGRGKGVPAPKEKDDFWRERYGDYLAFSKRERVTGKDLLSLGYTQGEALGAALKAVYERELCGASRAEILQSLKK